MHYVERNKQNEEGTCKKWEEAGEEEEKSPESATTSSLFSGHFPTSYIIQASICKPLLSKYIYTSFHRLRKQPIGTFEMLRASALTISRQLLRQMFGVTLALDSQTKAFSTEATHFGLTPDQIEFQRVAQNFAKSELSPHSAEWDAQRHFPIGTLRQAAALGFGGLFIQEDVGGSGLSRADGAVIFEALSYGDISVTAYLTIHNMVCSVIDRHGSLEQRTSLLPSLISMESLAAYCLTEPGSGSDAASLKTTAQKDGSDYLITGSKAFISGGGVADVYLVMARTGTDPGPDGISAFIVEKGSEGLSYGKKEKKMGWNAQPTAAVMFDNVRVPERNLIGNLGDGFKIAMQALDGGRINIAACSVGGAQFAFDCAKLHIDSRRQFGKQLSDFQATQFKLADMATSLHASRLLVRHAAQALDYSTHKTNNNKVVLPSVTLDCAIAKRFATDACFQVANDALQCFGGYGYLEEYSIERVVRDLRVHSILEGTNEIMRVIINRELHKLWR